MLKTRLALAAAAATALAVAAPAFAHSPQRDGESWKAKAHRRHERHGHARFYYRPAPRVVVVRPAPAVRYLPPQPVVVYRPPVVLAPRPFFVIREPGFSVSIGF